MARFLCKCGKTLSNSMAPNGIEYKVYSDIEWDKIINSECIEPLMIPSPKYDVWRCPSCERVYVFRSGEDEPIKRYILEPLDSSS